MAKLNRIKEVLVRYDKSQIWLSEQIGKSRVVVNRYCNNETQPSLEVLNRIANVLDVDVCDLLVRTKED